MKTSRRALIKIGAEAGAIGIAYKLGWLDPLIGEKPSAPQVFYTPPKNNSSTAPIRDELLARLGFFANANGTERLEERKEKKFNLNVIFPVGGTNGVIPAGMASSLLQYTRWLQKANNPIAVKSGANVFNKIIAGSAGAFTAPYFSAGQNEALAIFYHFLASPAFFKLTRWPQMDLNYVFKVMREDVPLHINSVLAPDAPKLEIRATEMPERKPVALTDFGTQQALFQAIRASARQPSNGSQPDIINGRKLIDAGFSDPLCLENAFNDISDTRYVLFSNLPRDSVPKNFAQYLLAFFPEFPSRDELIAARVRANSLRDQMEKAGRLLVIYPPREISSSETHKGVLEACAKEGMESFCSTLLNRTPAITRSEARLMEGNYAGLVPLFQLNF